MSRIPDPAKLAGHFFHTIVDGKVIQQGRVVLSPHAGWYLVQIYDWLSGSDYYRRLVPIEEMRTWLFYQDADAMNFSRGRGAAYRIEENAKLTTKT